MNNLRNLIFKSLTPRNMLSIRRTGTINIFEPDYLELMKPKLPLYDTLNIQMRGYDFCVLESYQRLVHVIAKNMDINIEDAWAVPAQEMQVTTYKPNSGILNSEYKLKTYGRVIQITDISSVQLPLLLRVLETSAPEGVTVSVVKHEDYHDEIRYVPDKELNTLKQTLEEMQDARTKK